MTVFKNTPDEVLNPTYTKVVELLKNVDTRKGSIDMDFENKALRFQYFLKSTDDAKKVETKLLNLDIEHFRYMSYISVTVPFDDMDYIAINTVKTDIGSAVIYDGALFLEEKADELDFTESNHGYHVIPCPENFHLNINVQ